MAWSYLEPRSSTVAASPAPTATVFSVQSGAGVRFIHGPATENGYLCNVLSIVGDQITLSAPLSYVPVAGEEFTQAIANAKDRVRWLIGDTDNTDQQLQDEEVEMALQFRPNALYAAADCAEAIAASFSRKSTYQIYQEISERMSDVAKQYYDLAKSLRRQGLRRGAVPVMGGLLVTDKEVQALDTTKVHPFFTRQMMTEPGTDPTAVDEDSGFYQPYY